MGSRWEFPGGKVEAGETPEQALSRELQEEFGLPVQVKEWVGTTEFFNNSTHYTLLAYMVDMEGAPVVLREHTQVGWFSLDSVEDLNLADSDRSLFKDIKTLLRSRCQA